MPQNLPTTSRPRRGLLQGWGRSRETPRGPGCRACRKLTAGQTHGTVVWLEDSEGVKARVKPKPSRSVQKTHACSRPVRRGTPAGGMRTIYRVSAVPPDQPRFPSVPSAVRRHPTLSRKQSSKADLGTRACYGHRVRAPAPTGASLPAALPCPLGSDFQGVSTPWSAWEVDTVPWPGRVGPEHPGFPSLEPREEVPAAGVPVML